MAVAESVEQRMGPTRPALAGSESRTAVAAGPPRYVPMAHPGVPGRWNRESILAALTAWIDETGTPPRRNDWCGEDVGSATAGQRKWMREHPRWPSGSCVAAHFGTWSQALEAANLPARNLTF